MSDSQLAAWGVVFLIYTVPFCMWALWRFARSQPAENSVFVWTAGLLVLLALSGLRAPPVVGAVLVLCAGVAAALVWRRQRTRR